MIVSFIRLILSVIKLSGVYCTLLNRKSSVVYSFQSKGFFILKINSIFFLRTNLLTLEIQSLKVFEIKLKLIFTKLINKNEIKYKKCVTPYPLYQNNLRHQEPPTYFFLTCMHFNQLDSFSY